jgi:hypothetical protein
LRGTDPDSMRGGPEPWRTVMTWVGLRIAFAQTIDAIARQLEDARAVGAPDTTRVLLAWQPERERRRHRAATLLEGCWELSCRARPLSQGELTDAGRRSGRG